MKIKETSFSISILFLFLLCPVLSLFAGDQGPLTELIKDLSDPSAVTREAAARELGSKGPQAVEVKQVVPALIKALEDGSINVQEAAAQALGQMGPAAKKAVPSLAGVVNDVNRWLSVRKRAVVALGEMGAAAKKAVPALADVVKDETSSMEEKAIIALGKIGPQARQAVPVLIGVLKDERGSIRYYATRALAKIGRAAVPELVKALHEQQARDERAGRHYEQGAVSPLLTEQDKKQQLFNIAVALALVKIGSHTKQALPFLINGLKDSRYEETAYVLDIIDALASAGTEAGEAVPVLSELAQKDQDRNIREQAAQALGKIQEK